MSLRGLSLLLIVMAPIAALSQSPWQGEWGAFSGDHAQQGRRLSIHDCNNTACKFFIDSRSPAANSGTGQQQQLTLGSGTAASATLPGVAGKPPCVLHMEREAGAKPAITVTATGETCTSYYATGPAATMSGIYPLRSTTIYGGPDPEQCFVDNSPASLATCTHPKVAALEQQWLTLAESYPLQPPASKDESVYAHARNMIAAILHSCDSGSNPENCLTARYSAEIAAMQGKKNADQEGGVQRGDPAQGGQLAQKIAGRYRHSFPNGDVQGDRYTTTDTLTIRPVGPASIHFDTELNFFNGHTCSLSGGALYRKDGSFVFEESPANNPTPEFPACRLAIIPTAVGVKFRDLTGGCKSSCGARGTLDGAEFTFKQRVADAPGHKSGATAKP